jgi:D-alanyl-D-alanine dipeptidase
MRSLILLFILSFEYNNLYSQSSPEEIIDMSEIIPGLVTDIKYATQDNFVKQKLYTVSKSYGSLTMAYSLKNIQDSLKAIGLGIKIFDAYRPRIIQWLLWEIMPDTTFVASPFSGSRHNRGSAVDLTLIDVKTGKELTMPTPFDDFTEKASHNYHLLPDSIKTNRTILKSIMEKFGFVCYNPEWWHYNHKTLRSYPLKDFQMR